MLIGNYSVLDKSPGRFYGGPSNRSNWNKSGSHRNRFVGWASYDKKAGTPNGYIPPYSWIIPITGGGMASYTLIVGSGSIGSANLAGGVNVTSSIAGSGSLSVTITGLADVVAALGGVGTLVAVRTATASLAATAAGAGALSADIMAIAVAGATLSGLGQLTDADLRSVLSLAATLSGSGNLTAEIIGAISIAATISGVGSITAGLNAIAPAVALLAGSGAITTADLRAIGAVIAALSGSGSISGTMRADGFMTADVSVGGSSDPLSPESLAAAVWNALVAAYGNTGTFGELVQTAVGVDYERIKRDAGKEIIPHVWAAKG